MNKRIIIVDEDLTRRNNTASRLRTQNYDPEISEGGFHTLNMIEKQKFGSILIFGNSHDMSGLEIIGLVRINNKKTDLPIIYVHKSKNQEDVIEAFDQGANEVIIHSDKYFASVMDRLKKISSQRV